MKLCRLIVFMMTHHYRDRTGSILECICYRICIETCAVGMDSWLMDSLIHQNYRRSLVFFFFFGMETFSMNFDVEFEKN